MEEPTIPQVRARLARATQLARIADVDRYRRHLAFLLVRRSILDVLTQLDDEARAELRALLAPINDPCCNG
ncbi:MAG: hypothetical protein A2135_09975 [Actinobacteria bacterium RBG_16_67_15]|nr:MAG: hypothetical protein A2135_09975 [Actinobacteria bacterium RBG_16_67_15]